MSELKERGIGKIGNYYGGLAVRDNNGVPEWGIENWNGTYWEEIPQELYIALNSFQNKLENKLNK